MSEIPIDKGDMVLVVEKVRKIFHVEAIDTQIVGLGCAGFMLSFSTGRDTSDLIRKVYLVPEVHFVQLHVEQGCRPYLQIGLKEDWMHHHEPKPVHPEDR